MVIFKKIVNNLKKQFKSYYSFVIVPNTHKKYFQLRIRKLYFNILIILLLSLGIYSLSLTIANKKISNEISKNVSEISELTTQNQQHQAYISQLENELQIMNEKLQKLESLELYIKDITGYQEEEEKEEIN